MEVSAVLWALVAQEGLSLLAKYISLCDVVTDC